MKSLSSQQAQPVSPRPPRPKVAWTRAPAAIECRRTRDEPMRAAVSHPHGTTPGRFRRYLPLFTPLILLLGWLTNYIAYRSLSLRRPTTREGPTLPFLRGKESREPDLNYQSLARQLVGEGGGDDEELSPQLRKLRETLIRDLGLRGQGNGTIRAAEAEPCPPAKEIQVMSVRLACSYQSDTRLFTHNVHA
jgi:hypothetical protein